jgi:hypothetical protein
MIEMLYTMHGPDCDFRIYRLFKGERLEKYKKILFPVTFGNDLWILMEVDI